MRLLITSDLHFNDKAMDRYRFGLFEWLAKEQRKRQTDALFILGDLTENKDRHPATLVNKVVEGLRLLRPPIYILRGNHDGIDPTCPYFKFLNAVEGVTFVLKTQTVHNGRFGMLPHCRDQSELNNNCTLLPKGLVAIFGHNTFEGAIAETGASLSGLRLAPIESLRPGAVWAGDIHRPQRVGRLLNYVGSPYHVRFGDDFNPRVVLLVDGFPKNLRFEAPRKWSLAINDATDLEGMEMREGDQVKIEITIPPEGAVDWAERKRAVLDMCKRLGVEVFGCTLKMPPRRAITRQATKTSKPVDILKEFCRNEKVPTEIASVGYALIE